MDIYEIAIAQGVVQVCTKCGLEKPISQFHKKATVRCGVERFCKACKSKYNAARYQKDPLVKLSVKVFRLLNPERVRETNNKSNKKNRAAIRLKAKQKYWADKAKPS